LTTSTQT